MLLGLKAASAPSQPNLASPMTQTDLLASIIGIEDFDRVDIRVGTIIAADPFPQARKPAYQLTIQFGPELGIKRSSAQITHHYTLEELVGRRVAAVVNFAPRQIGPFMSQVLCLGFPDADGQVVLLNVDRPVPDGGRLF